MASHSEQPSDRTLQASDSSTWPSLPVGAQNKNKPLKICIASPEFDGPQRNGGIGTFYTTLGMSLAKAGHDVTFLHTAPERITELRERWTDGFSQRNIKFDTIDMGCVKSVFSSRAIGHSYACCQYLKDKNFDMVHLPDWLGFAYYSLLAKRQGLSFQNTIFVIGAFGHEVWLRDGNGQQIADLDTLVIDFMERHSLALADNVVSHSRYMLNEQTKRGVVMPKKAYVQPNLLPENDFKGNRVFAPGTIVKVDEIVFAGRLDERKGLKLFCDSIDRMVARNTISADCKITFLGKSRWIDDMSAFEFIKIRSKHWFRETLILSKLNHDEALQYLGTKNRLAVVPSLKDNIPYTLVSSIASGIPVIASDVGGVREVIAEEFHEAILFAPLIVSLASKLESALSDGVKVAALAYDPAENETQWVAWHSELVIHKAVAESRLKLPLVSICIPYYDSPKTLKQAIASIEQQDYPNIEVVLVDDGSPSQIAQDLLDELKEKFAQRKWIIKRQDNKYLGAARNEAARLAHGEYLLFMDHDNVAKREEVSIFVKAALNTNADVLTCAYDVFSGDSPHDSTYLHTFVPLGAAISPGLYKNFYGDANALVKKEAFNRLGGFTEDYGIWGEDWEFFAKAALQGVHMEAVPESLFWYREHPGSMHNSTRVAPGRLRALRPYLASVPTELQEALMLAITSVDLSIKPLEALPKSEYAKPDVSGSQKPEMEEQPEQTAVAAAISNPLSRAILMIKQIGKQR